jgi:alpha-glucosidase
MLGRTISTALNLSLSGVTYTGPDIGGFSGDPSPELYTRWFQLAAWLPFFRSHSVWTMPSREPWRAAGPHLDAIREAMAWRYRLLPYWYTQAVRHADGGDPIIRPVWWADEADEVPELGRVDDAFLVGPDVLVAPVVAEGATARSVLLPPGAWWDLEGTATSSGHVEVDVTMARIPVFVRAGAVLPTEEDGSDVLALYPAAAGSHESWWVRDAGDGLGGRRVECLEAVGGPDGTWTVQRRVVEDGFAVDHSALAVRVAGGPATVAVDGGEARPVGADQPLVVGDWAELVVRRT